MHWAHRTGLDDSARAVPDGLAARLERRRTMYCVDSDEVCGNNTKIFVAKVFTDDLTELTTESFVSWK